MWLPVNQANYKIILCYTDIKIMCYTDICVTMFYYNNFSNLKILIKLTNVLCYNDFCVTMFFLTSIFYFCAIVAFVWNCFLFVLR